MSSPDQILKQFADQALACEHLGSPLTARICRATARVIDERTQFGRRILSWDGDPYADNVALRAAGGLHALARTNWEPALTSVYPPNNASEHTLGIAIRDTLTRHDRFLADRLSSPPQTNEVARSAIILGAMLSVAEVTGQPLEIFEIGASAGLNLGFDGYRYALGEGRGWGDPGAPLTLECAWRGSVPSLVAPLTIIGRHGCDLQPIDPDLGADRERLLSFVWADQTHRLARLDTALKLAAAAHRQVNRGDAAEWLEQKFAVPQQPGVTRVLFHSIVWQYLPTITQDRISALLQRLGQSASLEAPLAHIAIEADATPSKGARIDMTLWPTGTRLTLGRGDFHGSWADWA